MFNLLRMDLYRIKRSKSVYICLAVILFSIFLCFGLIYLRVTPQGQEIAAKIGMDVMIAEAESDMLEGENSLTIFRESCMDGGAYNLFFGIVIVLFVCMDFQSGFIKNIMASHRERWQYIGSKLMLAGIIDFCYIAFGIGFSSLLNALLHVVPFAAWNDILFYFVWVWIVTMAFASMMIMICIFTRSIAASIVSAIAIGSGVIVVTLSSLMEYFHAGGWKDYTIYFSMLSGASKYGAVSDLKVVGIGAVYLAVYTIVGVIKCGRQDV